MKVTSKSHIALATHPTSVLQGPLRHHSANVFSVSINVPKIFTLLTLFKISVLGCKCNSVVEWLPSMYQALNEALKKLKQHKPNKQKLRKQPIFRLERQHHSWENVLLFHRGPELSSQHLCRQLLICAPPSSGQCGFQHSQLDNIYGHNTIFKNACPKYLLRLK